MGKRLLLVEGKDDQHVMWNLFEARRVADTFEVECPETDGDANESGGIERLLDSIRWRLATGELERLAVVVDANHKGPAARWQAIRDRLVNAGFDDLPKEHSPNGTVFDLSLRPQTPRSIRFGVWIMPDNRSSGMLEDFVISLIREDDRKLPLVDGFLDSIPAGKDRFTEPHRPKARVHTWLAVGDRPGRPMGQAIKADRQLDANHPTVQPFLDWVQDALVE